MHIPAFASGRYLRIVRASGWYDLLVTWPFALPWTFAWLYTQLNLLAQALALPGTLHPLDTTHMLLANLLGSVVADLRCGTRRHCHRAGFHRLRVVVRRAAMVACRRCQCGAVPA